MPINTMMGSLFDFITSAEPKHFQPMAPNFGILPELPTKVRSKPDRNGQYRDRSFSDLETWATQHHIKLQKTYNTESTPEAMTEMTTVTTA